MRRYPSLPFRRRWFGAAALALVLPAAAVAGWSNGDEIDNALVVDLTDDGLDAASDLIPALLPDVIDVPDITQTGYVDYWFGTWDWALYVTNVWVGDTVTDANLTPGSGVINLDATAVLWVNDSSDKFNITFDTDWGTWADCDTYIEPFNFRMNGSIALTILDDGINPPYLDATVGEVIWDWDVTNDHVVMDCWVGDMDTIMDYVGLSPIEMALDYAAEEIDGQIEEMKPELEAAIEDAFAAANIDQEISLGESTMHVTVSPTAIEITPDGVRVLANGSFSSTTDPCVAEYGHTESLATPSEVPNIGYAPAGVPDPYHLGVEITDDFVNQGLYAAYNAGLLCYTLENDGSLPLDTSLLTLLSSEGFGPLFPEQKPILVQTRPAGVPTAAPTGGHDINIAVDQLGVDFMADLDYRYANVVAVDLDIDAGIDLDLDETTGLLAIAVAMEGEDVVPSIRSNEFAVGHEDEILASFSTLFDTVVQPIVGDALSGFTFGMPTYAGIGLTSLDAAPTGTNEDWFGVYANIGPVAYTNESGCGGDGGGCETGCGTGGIPARGALFLVPLLLGALRRRTPTAR